MVEVPVAEDHRELLHAALLERTPDATGAIDRYVSVVDHRLRTAHHRVARDPE